jgi:methyltransferase OMS1, mitochondrial
LCSELHPKYANVKFVTQDAALPMTSPSSAGFNTIIQTMGLCSTPRPVDLLRNLGTLCNKEDCRILLLEHGRSHYRWLNRILDNLAPVHADKYGCWWNRDIGGIVEESGLEVVKISRYHLGTTWWIELKPSQDEGKSAKKVTTGRRLWTNTGHGSVVGNI